MKLCDVVTKEEPEDLAYLAPIAGDEFIALDVPLLDDLLESLGQTDIEYVYDGKIVDIDSEELPLVTISSGKNEQKSFEKSIDLSLLELNDKDGPTVVSPERYMKPIRLTEDPKSSYLSTSMKNMGGGVSSPNVYTAEVEYMSRSPSSVTSPSKLNSPYMLEYNNFGSKNMYPSSIDSGLDSPVHGSPCSDDSDFDPMRAPVRLCEVFPALVPTSPELVHEK